MAPGAQVMGASRVASALLSCCLLLIRLLAVISALHTLYSPQVCGTPGLLAVVLSLERATPQIMAQSWNGCIRAETLDVVHTLLSYRLTPV